MSTHYLPLAPSARIVAAPVSELEPWGDGWELWTFLGLRGWEERVGWMELRVPGTLWRGHCLFSGNW